MELRQAVFIPHPASAYLGSRVQAISLLPWLGPPSGILVGNPIPRATIQSWAKRRVDVRSIVTMPVSMAVDDVEREIWPDEESVL